MYHEDRTPGTLASTNTHLVMCYVVWIQSLIHHSDIRSKADLQYNRAFGIVLGRRERNTAACGFVGCLYRRFIDMCVCVCVCVCEGGGSNGKQIQAI